MSLPYLLSQTDSLDVCFFQEREKAERAAAKVENILGMREERQRAKDRISIYHDERRAQELKARDMVRARMIDRIERRELNRLNFLDKQQEHKVGVG